MSPVGDTHHPRDKDNKMQFDSIRKTVARVLAGAAVMVMIGAPVSRAANQAEEENSGVWKFGTEIDALPYATKGYYGSAIAGHTGWRYRAIVARNTTPSFMVTDGFRDKRTDAYAVLADRFFGAKRQQLEGFWIGGGGEYWRNRIRTDESPEYAHYNNFVLTLGGGYVWKLSRHFFLNPWVGTHFVTAGERRIQVTGRTYKQPVFTPEASLKIGFTF